MIIYQIILISTITKTKKRQFKKDQAVYQYDSKTKKLIATYENVDQITVRYPNYLYSNIWRVCSGKRKTAYGYIWSLTKLGI